MPARADTARGPGEHKLAFRLLLALGACGLTAAAAAMVAAAGSVHRQPGAAHRVLVDGQQFTYPAVNAAAAVLLAVAAVGTAALVTAVRAAVRQVRAHRRLLRHIRVLGHLPDRPSVNVIADDRPQAFCAGYLSPRVYVSSGALELLSREELGAVLLHEEHHRQVRDPLRAACGRILSQALFFLPVLQPLRDLHSDVAELAADAAAVDASGGEKGPLASALLAFDSSGPPGTAGISPARVDSLLGEPRGSRLPAALTLLALATLGGLVVVLWRMSAAASAQATFNLPVLSSQPCMLVLALLPVLSGLCALAVGRRLRANPRFALSSPLR